MKRFIPDYYAKNIYEVPMSFFVEHHFKQVFSDLDNTLDSYALKDPSQKALDLVKSLKELGIELIIISNNKGERVGRYSRALGVRYLSSSCKPFGKKIRNFIKDNNFNPNEIILIGDQFVTDVRAGKNAHIKTMVVDKLVDEDQWTTKFNRIPDTIIRKYLKKKNILQNREVK